MQTQLPRRPYVELPPPPDGLVSAQREGGRRRTRRTVATVSGGVGAIVMTVVAVVLLSGGGGVAVLRPAPVAPATQPPSPVVSSAASVPANVTHGGAASHQRQSPNHAVGNLPVVAGGPSTAPSGASAPPVRHGQADASVAVTRTSGRNSAGPQVCRTGASSENTAVHPGDNWCPTVTAVSVSGGERLSYTLCRDSTSAGTLHFPNSREVNFSVVRNGATVWRYTAHSSASPSPHTLTAKADDCWTWSLVWPGTTDSGAAAPHDRYTVSATSTADEFEGAPLTTATFDY
jgi:hypothetical protein